MTHLLLTAPIAQQLWKQFAYCAGIHIDGLTLQQVIHTWWNHKGNPTERKTIQAIPSTLIRELWKRRNARRYRKEITLEKMKYHLLKNVFYLVKSRFPWIKDIPYHWQGMLEALKAYIPRLHYLIMK